mgnify:CR=1 FL=1
MQKTDRSGKARASEPGCVVAVRFFPQRLTVYAAHGERIRIEALEADLLARFGRVVYGISDPKMGCLGGATNLNDLPRVNHHVELTSGGVLESECRELLQAFFRLKRREE